MEQESWKMDKDETGRQPPEGPILCANNCGFFGSTTTLDLCSQCYRNYVMKQAKAADASTAMSAKQSTAADESSHAVTNIVGTSSSQSEMGSDADRSAAASVEMIRHPQQPNRCFTCKKRVGLTGFKCRCGNQFCSLHRYHDKHHCLFDYHAAAQDAIAKANPIIKADKVDKI